MGYNSKDSQLYAIKIINKDKNLVHSMKTLMKEKFALDKLEHPNIIKEYKFSSKGAYTKRTGEVKKE